MFPFFLTATVFESYMYLLESSISQVKNSIELLQTFFKYDILVLMFQLWNNVTASAIVSILLNNNVSFSC